MSEKLQKVLNWLEEFKTKNNVKGVVLGLSGGKDSTVVAMLAKKVFGDKVVAVMMPNGNQKDIHDSIDIANQLGLLSTTININGAFDYIVNTIADAEIGIPDDCDFYGICPSDKSKTNLAPRLRMSVLYLIAQTMGYLVIGTGNASEAFIGWTTKWGDSAADLNPLKYLTCTEVIELGKELAKEFGLDEKYIVKQPSDGLTMKSDEDNFGFTYKELDYYITNGFPDLDHELLLPDDLEQRSRVIKMLNMHKWSEHKRHPVSGPGDKICE